MHIDHAEYNKERIGCALVIAVLLLLMLPGFIPGGGLLKLAWKWPESALF